MSSIWWKICSPLHRRPKWICIPIWQWRFTFKHQSNRSWKRFWKYCQKIPKIQGSQRIWVHFIPRRCALYSTKVLAFCQILIEKLLIKFLVLNESMVDKWDCKPLHRINTLKRYICLNWMLMTLLCCCLYCCLCCCLCFCFHFCLWS